MPKICFFNRFPVELIHEIFAYLWTHDIFHSFFHLTPYIDRILVSYYRFHINFKSISMSIFDHICHHIRSEQIMTLILSDDFDTLNQSERFFSLFNLNNDNFSNLRSLSLIYFKMDLSFINPNKLLRLSSLTIDNNLNLPLVCKFASKLRQLNIYNDEIFNHDDIQFPYLRHLTIMICSFNQLKKIFQRAINLRSIDIKIYAYFIPNSFNFEQQHLIRLSFVNKNENSSSMTFTKIEQLLLLFPHLRHFVLQTSTADVQLCNGYLWERFFTLHLPFLQTFDFYFKLAHLNLNILNSFRSPFWLKDKRWFVVYDADPKQISIYTIPRFVRHHIEYGVGQIQSTDKQFLFNDHITHLKLSPIFNDEQLLIEFLRYKNVQSIQLNWAMNENSTEQLESIVDFDRIEELNMGVSVFYEIIFRLPHLQKLIIHNFSFNSMTNLQNKIFKQIHSLRIYGNGWYCIEKPERIPDLFPKLQCLSTPLHHDHQIIFLLTHLKHLCTAQFEMISLSPGPYNIKRVTHEWLAKESNHSFDFTFYITDSIDHYSRGSRIRLWINNELRHSRQNVRCCMQ